MSALEAAGAGRTRTTSRVLACTAAIRTTALRMTAEAALAVPWAGVVGERC